MGTLGHFSFLLFCNTPPTINWSCSLRNYFASVSQGVLHRLLELLVLVVLSVVSEATPTNFRLCWSSMVSFIAPAAECSQSRGSLGGDCCFSYLTFPSKTGFPCSVSPENAVLRKTLSCQRHCRRQGLGFCLRSLNSLFCCLRRQGQETVEGGFQQIC